MIVNSFAGYRQLHNKLRPLLSNTIDRYITAQPFDIIFGPKQAKAHPFLFFGRPAHIKNPGQVPRLNSNAIISNHNFDHSLQYPIILEYLPYRKDEHRASRYGVFNYFVQNGYLVARVDIRGTGRSEGEIVPYEYSDQELDDGEVVIQHLSELNFSNGNVAVFGISWGGFNALQLAMKQTLWHYGDSERTDRQPMWNWTR